MKKVFSNSEVAHVFASRTQDEGRSANVFFNRHTIYSYGYHFPMSSFSKDGQTVYFTTRGYSNSTAKHLNYTRQALNHFKMIYCYNPEEARGGNHKNNLNDFNANAKNISYKLANARKPETYLSQIEDERNSFNAYCEHFNIKVTKKLMATLPYLFIESKDGGNEATAKERKLKEKEEKQRQAREIQRRKEEAIKHAEDLEKFRAFKLPRLYNRIGFDHLRFNPETQEIQTSQGVSIDIEEARRVYNVLLTAIERGGCTDCGKVDGKYQINSVTSQTVVIGCHEIQVSEILTVGSEIFN